MTAAGVVDELVARFRRARDQHAAAGRTGGVEVFVGLLAWMDANGGQLAEVRGRHLGVSRTEVAE